MIYNVRNEVNDYLSQATLLAYLGVWITKHNFVKRPIYIQIKTVN